MPRYQTTPHDKQGPFSEAGAGEGPELESIETTYADDASLIPGGVDRRTSGAPPEQPKPPRRWLGARLFAALFHT